jgi:hypothetical protein
MRTDGLPLFDSKTGDVVRLRERAKAGFQICPWCGGREKVYRRKLNSGMARVLIWMAVHDPGSWVHVPTAIPKIIAQNRDFTKLQHWGLLEERENVDTGKRSSGFWKILPKGMRFAHQEIELPSHCFMRSPGEEVLGFEDTRITVTEALGRHFDYAALMGGWENDE